MRKPSRLKKFVQFMVDSSHLIILLETKIGQVGYKVEKGGNHGVIGFVAFLTLEYSTITMIFGKLKCIANCIMTTFIYKAAAHFSTRLHWTLKMIMPKLFL